MNKSFLKEYQGCRKAILDYASQIEELEGKLNSLKQHELVKGSDIEHPFRYHYISVHGIPLGCKEAMELKELLFKMKILRREKIVK